MEFAALPLRAPLQLVLQELGLRTLTPVQEQSIPVLLAGGDLLGQSQTGTGKTAAFALPVLERVALSPRQVQALVLCPTRELCSQVAGEFRRLGRRLPGLQALVVAGGQPVRPQVQALEKGAHIVVGTPGRVLDLLERAALDLAGLATVVLDEADRMLDMGFREDMQRILERTPARRQTVLFSATFPPDIEALSRALQRNPTRVILSETSAPSGIRQVCCACEPEQRTALLLRLLRQLRPESAIVFCNLKATVAQLTRTLTEAGIGADGLQGDLEQTARERAMAKFRNRSTRVLVATDVAARGLDVESVDAVFNFDLPSTPEAYVHRVGRTGRAGRGGLAVSLASPRDAQRLQVIETATGVGIERASPESLPSLGGAASLEAAMATLLVFAGRKDKMRPGDLLGALTGEAGGLAAADVGKIEIHDRVSFVAVSRGVAGLAFQRLRDGRIKGRKHRIERVR